MATRPLLVLLAVWAGLVGAKLRGSSPPSRCDLTIVRCCDSDTNTALPRRCFEVNGCPGLHWVGKKACSKAFIVAAKAKVFGSTAKEIQTTDNSPIATPNAILPAPTRKPAASIKTATTRRPRPITTTRTPGLTPVQGLPGAGAKAQRRPRPVSTFSTKCQLSIVRCCDTTLNTALPLRCFEINGCPGLYWVGRKVCASDKINAAATALNKKLRRRRKKTGAGR